MKRRIQWGTLGLIMGFLSMLSVPVYAGFGHGPIHTRGPMYGDIADFELVTFNATVDYVQPPVMVVTDEQTVQWTIYAGNVLYWQDRGYDMEVGDSITVTGASLMYGTGVGGGGGMHGGGGFPSDGASSHFVVFSIDDHTTGQSMQFRNPDTGAPMWGHFGPQQ
ncbi:MAG: hypothetical protein HY788_00120 [Deltaproteobacteria bacterium]|nr:hypothetical protein [Deltaproteobacteria bacterium]